MPEDKPEEKPIDIRKENKNAIPIFVVLAFSVILISLLVIDYSLSERIDTLTNSLTTEEQQIHLLFNKTSQQDIFESQVINWANQVNQILTNKTK